MCHYIMPQGDGKRGPPVHHSGDHVQAGRVHQVERVRRGRRGCERDWQRGGADSGRHFPQGPAGGRRGAHWPQGFATLFEDPDEADWCED